MRKCLSPFECKKKVKLPLQAHIVEMKVRTERSLSCKLTVISIQLLRCKSISDKKKKNNLIKKNSYYVCVRMWCALRSMRIYAKQQAVLITKNEEEKTT